MKLLIKLFVSSLAVLITAYILKGVEVDGYVSAIIVAAVLGILNVTVKPIMVIFTLPATILTLGLFLLVINALVILLADYLLGGFNVTGFWWALAFSLILSLINSIFFSLIDANKKN